MTLQKTVYTQQAIGVIGDFADDSPKRVAPYNLTANGEVMPVIGCAFTQGTADNEATIGGSGAFVGVAVNSKDYAIYNNLTASLELPDNSIGQLCTMGHVYVTSTTAVTPGYIAAFNPTTGAIAAYEDSEAAGTASATVIPNAKFIRISAKANEVAILELT